MEDKTETLRIVVRESMSADLIDRLVADIVAVTERLMASEPVDVAALQTGPTSIARQRMLSRHSHVGKEKGSKGGNKTHHWKGIHRGVC